MPLTGKKGIQNMSGEREMICWLLCKKLKSEQTDEWFMYKSESVQENNTHKILCYFDIT